MTERSYRLLFWCLALGGLLGDLGSKYLAFHLLYPDEQAMREAHLTGVLRQEYDLVPGWFKFHTQFTGEVESGAGLSSAVRSWGGELLPRVNHGALFGLGGEYQHYANSIFAIVSVLAALTIIFWSTRPSMARDWSLCASLGLILAGTLGNLFDRVFFGGVRDFLYFYWIEWPVFNIADCCLVVGASLLLLQAFWTPAQQESARPLDTASTTAAA